MIILQKLFLLPSYCLNLYTSTTNKMSFQKKSMKGISMGTLFLNLQMIVKL